MKKLKAALALFAVMIGVFAAMPMQAQAAPAYGTKGSNQEKTAAFEQVKKTAEALQEQVDAAASKTYGHNVKVVNYSDPDENGLIYESDGSGVIVAMDGNMVYIATAAHCLKRTHTKVTFADGSEYDAYIGYRNPNKDVGFLLVSQAALKPETLAAALPAAGADAAVVGKTAGDTLFAVSSSDVPNGSVSPGVLDSYSVVYPNNPKQNVLQFLSTTSYGSSGGGVYTLEGIWVGSVSGGDTYGKCWAVPYSDIMVELYGWLNTLAMQQAAG